MQATKGTSVTTKELAKDVEKLEKVEPGPPKKKRCVVKLSDEMQLQFLEAAMQQGVKAAAAQYGVSHSTAHRWARAWDPTVGVDWLLIASINSTVRTTP